MNKVLRRTEVVAVKIFLAALLKFICGCDDVLWLTPFMAKANRAQKWGVGARYVLSVTVLTIIAILIAVSLDAALENTSHREDTLVSSIISFVAAGLLMAYALSTMYDEGYFDSCRRPREKTLEDPLLGEEHPTYGSDDKDDDDDGCAKRALVWFLGRVLCFKSVSSRQTAPTDAADSDEFRVDDVVVVACLGSMDDFIVYLSIALSSEFAWYELIPGIMFGAIIIAACVAILMTASESLAAFLAKIPVPVILMFLSAYIVISVFVPFLP